MFHSEDVRQRIRQQPFVPLRIVTSSGESYTVQHPELVMFGRNSLVIGRPGSRERPWEFESFDRVSVMHITALEDLPGRRRSGRNGNH